ncbi:MAG: Stp1/IreP family PP2C-type Ser/Thr phosphatase [Deltaproteobacteria bacterium]|nr:Stp1/IreP family PP2C-type Ser/Thr phosphatase [Deltaproteobacteria bacterium]
MRIHGFALSDIGRVRQENQDSSGLFPEHNLFVVADGMGGHKGGKQASETAVATIQQSLPPPGPTAEFDAALARFVDAVGRANQRILERAASDAALERMGTTLVALLLDGQSGGAVVHVGDSRAYRLRGGELELLTSDHTIVNDLLRDHEISEAEAKAHPYRHVLTRALGAGGDATADVRRITVEAEDVYVLCSDGISGMLAAEEICAILVTHAADPQAVCRQLIEAANRAGGKDNATVIAVRCAPD